MKPYTGFEKFSDEELIHTAENGADLSQELAKRYAAMIDARRAELKELLEVKKCPECGYEDVPF